MIEISNPLFEDFEFEQIYHLFTQTNGNDIIFKNHENYRYFFQKLSEYLFPIMDFYAYCLTPKQLHFLVCFKSYKEICKNLSIEEKELQSDKIHAFLMQPVSNFLNAYAKAFNKMYARKGALFVDYIKRTKLDDEDSLKNTMKNIHLLPFTTFQTNDFKEWKYSSYQAYLDLEKPSKLNRKFMIDFFENRNDFIQFHHLTNIQTS